MAITVTTTDRGTIEITKLPEKCPFCHNYITPHVVTAHKSSYKMADIFMWCPSPDCKSAFIGYYEYFNKGVSTSVRNYDYIGKTSKGNMIGKHFNDVVSTMSPSFPVIYNQAYFAEQNDLFEICGVGYRKALEFLIKDYAKTNNPGKESVIEGKLLAQCIGEFVTDDRIKAVAKRAVWLGNDETHYIRKWEGKNLEDLKKLIDLTVHWIEMEALTKSFEFDMPDQ